MKEERKAALLAGGFYFVGLAAGLLSVVPVVDLPDYLVQISTHANQVTIGALFQFIMMVAYMGMALALYPLLKKQSERLALGFLGFRLIAATIIVIGVITLPLLLTLSQQFVTSGASELSHFQTIGEMLRTARDLVNHTGTILVLSLGGLLLNVVLYKTKLVPRWLSGWGFLGALIAIVTSCLFLTRLIDLTTSVYLDFPLAIQEIVFAIWLLVKGFNPSSNLKEYQPVE